jgi:hypothetical protein
LLGDQTGNQAQFAPPRTAVRACPNEAGGGAVVIVRLFIGVFRLELSLKKGFSRRVSDLSLTQQDKKTITL